MCARNDELRMTNDETNPNDEIGNGARFAAHFFGIGASSFIRHSCFVIFPSHLLRHLDPEKVETLFQDSSGQIAQGEARTAHRFL